MKRILCICLCFLWICNGAYAQSGPKSQTAVCAECIRKNMEFLASDELRGRGSASEDEKKAAVYIGDQLKAYGIEPLGDNGGFVQRVQLTRNRVSGPPTLTFDVPSTQGATAKRIEWTFGKEFISSRLPSPGFSGPIRHLDVEKGEAKVLKGDVVVLGSGDQAAMVQAYSAGAVAVLVPAKRFNENAALPKLSLQIEGVSKTGPGFTVLSVRGTTMNALSQVPDGATVHFKAPLGAPETKYTWNALGILKGSDPSLQHEAVLFSAHLDHLGVGTPVNGDSIYNGADDDASGTCAVLEVARVLGAAPKPKRTVLFALFGSEELGGLGSTYFREHPPVPLDEITANLEFEMIGRADSAVKSDTLWLTGWERSNLGPVLAEHGAKLVEDPHPSEGFFMRSDNYVLAKKGVVAQTISSYGLHSDYHQPSDDVAHIDFQHMDDAIGSLLGPVKWLVNSDFKPQWNKGGQP
jgi:Peptidase family M28